MKVRVLIELLGYEDEDAEVHFSYNYGDYWRTSVAPKVRKVEEGCVEYSEYHSMDKLADADSNPDQNSRVVILS